MNNIKQNVNIFYFYICYNYSVKLKFKCIFKYFIIYIYQTNHHITTVLGAQFPIGILVPGRHVLVRLVNPWQNCGWQHWSLKILVPQIIPPIALHWLRQLFPQCYGLRSKDTPPQVWAINQLLHLPKQHVFQR